MSEETKIETKKLNKKLIIVAAAVIAVTLIIALVIIIPKSVNAKNLEKQLNLGAKYLSELNYEQAIVSYQAAIEIDPKNVDAYLGLAEAYMAQGEYEKAEDILNRAITELGETEEIKALMKRVVEEKKAMEVTPTPEPTSIPEPIPSVASYENEEFYYDITNGEVTITLWKAKKLEVVIPEAVDGYPVTCISESALEKQDSIRSVEIPESVTNIGDNVLCDSVEAVYVKRNSYAESWAERNGYPVRYIGEVMMMVTPSPTATSTPVPSNTPTPEPTATSTPVPSNTPTPEPTATSTPVPTATSTPTPIISTDSQYILYRIEDNAVTITGIKENYPSEIIIPEKIEGLLVTSIEDWAFVDCSGLTSVTIPSGVTNIGNGVFAGCENLVNVIIQDSITSIGVGAFDGCKNLTSIIIPDSVTSIGNYAFDECENLTSVIIPSGVTSIGEGVFASCENLTNVTIPGSVTSIGAWAFAACYSLTNVTIPDSVTSIGDYAFKACENLTDVTIPSSVTNIYKSAFGYRCWNLIIHCEEDSYALAYAKKYGHEYVIE